MRVFAPPPGPVRGARLVIAPGASVAVQLWRGESERSFMRALVCNR